MELLGCRLLENDMIVFTSINNTPRCVEPGDEFALAITDGMGCSVLVREKITRAKTIDFIASFRFALPDGTCPGFHLMGVFAVKSELPVELANGVRIEDLTEAQRERFVATCGTSTAT